MRSHRTQPYAALFALFTTTAVAQYATLSVPSDSRCAGLIGPALHACLTQPAGGSAAPALPRNAPEPATPTSPAALSTPLNIVNPATPSSPSLPSAPQWIGEPTSGGRIREISAVR